MGTEMRWYRAADALQHRLPPRPLIAAFDPEILDYVPGGTHRWI
jgi:hypothetical protein